jgi:hypothetical protein
MCFGVRMDAHASGVQMKAKAQRRAPGSWDEVRALYVEGEDGKGPNASRHWPTLDECAERFGFASQSVRRKAARERWTDQRNLYSSKVAAQRAELRTAAMLREAAEFDSESLSQARALLREVNAALEDAARLRKLRDQRLKRLVDDPDETRKVLAAAPISAQALTGLAGTLAQAQKVGRLALGDPTDNTNAQHQHSGEVGVAHSGAVAVSHDLAADPARLAEVARILREAGVE